MTAAEEPRSLESRIASRLTGDGSVIISARMAQWLEREVRMTADRRIRLRNNDPEAYENLVALHIAALGSGSGTNDAASLRISADSKMWMSTGQAAQALGVTDRCIRNWCRSGRLIARHIGRSWLVNPNSIAALQHNT